MARYYTQKSTLPEDFDHPTFVTELAQVQCQSYGAHGRRCKNIVTVGVPFCTLHWKADFHLKSGPSTIDGAGLGVFAYGDPDADENTVVFQDGEEVCEYIGEKINKRELDNRYGEATAAYAYDTQEPNGTIHFIDAAGYRSLASMINHSERYPNVESRDVRDANGRPTGRTGIYAIGTLMHEEELLLNYGEQYQFDDNLHSTTFARMYRNKGGERGAVAALERVYNRGRGRGLGRGRGRGRGAQQ